MKRVQLLAMMALALSMAASAQSATPTPPAPSAGQADKQSNAASATQDNSAISGDQVTKPAGAKSSTVIGCLSGPDAAGHFMLSSMQNRYGLEVLGPSDLETAAGQKVKLTGQYIAGADSQDAHAKDRRFQTTSFEVLAEKCPPPAVTTPVSKQKQKQQKAAAKDAGNNPQ